jgi:hypothetical protein
VNLRRGAQAANHRTDTRPTADRGHETLSPSLAASARRVFEQQFPWAERLQDVIVCAKFEPDNPVNFTGYACR